MQAAALYSALVIFLCTISFVTPFQCYVCNSDFPGNCGSGSDVDKEFLIDCDKANKTLGGGTPGINWSVCRKIITWVDFDVNTQKGGIERVLRRCGYDKEKSSDTCVYRGGLGGRQRVCSCETEGCNSAPGFTTMTVATTAAMSLLVPVFIKTMFQ